MLGEDITVIGIALGCTLVLSVCLGYLIYQCLIARLVADISISGYTDPLVPDDSSRYNYHKYRSPYTRIDEEQQAKNERGGSSDTEDGNAWFGCFV